MSTEETINVTPDVVEDEKSQMDQLKKAAHELIDKCDGFIVFCFEDKDVELQGGQKTRVPKNMLGAGGAMGGGSVSLPFVATKAKSLLEQENAARAEQMARLSE